MIYGGYDLVCFPKVDDAISWEGHLAGFIVGLLLSLLYKTEIIIESSNTIGKTRL
jgi:membrane associated rhomboid family serine protease